MTLFEIDSEIRSFLDTLYLVTDEDGTVSDDDVKALNRLQRERKQKLENVALYYKELVAEAEALSAESKKLATRAKAVSDRAEWFKNYLANSMKANGDKEFKTTRCSLTFRKSESVQVDMEKIDKKYLTEKVEYSADKRELKQLLKSGMKIDGAWIEVNQNIQIN